MRQPGPEGRTHRSQHDGQAVALGWNVQQRLVVGEVADVAPMCLGPLLPVHHGQGAVHPRTDAWASKCKSTCESTCESTCKGTCVCACKSTCTCKCTYISLHWGRTAEVANTRDPGQRRRGVGDPLAHRDPVLTGFFRRPTVLVTCLCPSAPCRTQPQNHTQTASVASKSTSMRPKQPLTCADLPAPADPVTRASLLLRRRCLYTGSHSME